MSPDTGPLVRYDKPEPGIAWLTLNRPDRLNAINLAMRDDLWTFLEAVRLDPDVRVLCVRGLSGRAFSAGADISEFGGAPSYLEARRARQDRDLWGAWEALPVVTIAALHGFCFGAGLELPLYCDLRFGAPDTVLALPEVTLGYLPSAGGTQTLPRTVPPALALRLILSGDRLDAATAAEWGLLHRVVPADRLEPEVAALARRLAAADASTLQAAKQAIRQGLNLPLPAALARDALRARRIRRRAPGRPG